MPISLEILIEAAQSAEGDVTPAAAVAAKLAEAAGADEVIDIPALQAEARKEFEDLGKTAKPTEAAATMIETLVEVVEGTRVEQARQADLSRAHEDRMAELAKRMQGDDPAADADADADADKGADADADADTSTDADAAAAGADTGDADTTVTEDSSASEGVPALAASAAPRRRGPAVRLSDIPRNKVTAPVENQGRVGPAIVASGDRAGQKLEGIKGLTAAAVDLVAGFPNDVPGIYMKKNIATIRLADAFPDDLTADGGNDQEVIDHAGDPSRLPGGSLIAAGGWCSPSEILYDLAPALEDPNAGLVSISDIQAKRGGLRWTEGPDFSLLYTGVGFQQTEAQAIAGAEKTCYRVPCPSFTEERAEAIGFCIEAGILQNDSFPELTERVVEGSIAVHEHKVNATTLAKMEALSTVVGTVEVGPSAATALLNGVELQIMDYRYLYRAPESLQLEVKLPIWSKVNIRGDLSLRAGVPFDSIDDAQIAAHFAKRGAKVEFVYDWQDAFTGVTGGFGSATAITSYPGTVKAMIFGAGTFVRARGEIIKLDGIYDSVNVKKNDFVRLFTEEKLLVIRRQFKSRLVTIPLNVNGATGAARELDADGKIVVPTP